MATYKIYEGQEKFNGEMKVQISQSNAIRALDNVKIDKFVKRLDIEIDHENAKKEPLAGLVPVINGEEYLNLAMTTSKLSQTVVSAISSNGDFEAIKLDSDLHKESLKYLTEHPNCTFNEWLDYLVEKFKGRKSRVVAIKYMTKSSQGYPYEAVRFGANFITD